MPKTKKGRPKRKKLAHQAPRVLQFSPRGFPGRPQEIVLSRDEFEALRLVDLDGLEQAQAGSYMCTSRPTVGRIIRRARNKLADAIVNGKIIKISPAD